jgi:hypothetical protein
MRRPARSGKAPEIETARRLEEVRAHKGVLSLRSFWSLLKDGWTEEAGRVSYEAMRKYHHKSPPSVAYLKRVAEVFEVRIQYLVGMDDAMTADLEEVRRVGDEVAGDESEAPVERLSLDEFIGAVQLEFCAGCDRLQEDTVIRVVLTEACRRLFRARLLPRLQRPQEPLIDLNTPLSGIGAGVTRITVPQTVHGDGKMVVAVAMVIGKALRAPFSHLPIRPEDLSDDDLLDHVVRTCQVLKGLADAGLSQAPGPKDLEEDEDV